MRSFIVGGLVVLLACSAVCDDDWVWISAQNETAGQLSTNSTSEEGPWTIVSFITLMPFRCSDVQKIVSWFDEALRDVNPGIQIESMAQRLGMSMCDASGCPCNVTRRYTTKVMEIRTQSMAKTLLRPLREKFPYEVQSNSVL